MKTKIILFSILLFSLSATAQSTWQESLAKAEYSTNGEILPYRLYVPKIDSSKQLSLVLFLHGAGERGTDNESQLLHGVKYFLSEEICKEFNFILIAPQCPESARWVEVDWSKPSHKMPHISIPLEMTFNLLDSIVAEYNIDTNKIFISGLSMGGFGTWDAMQRRPDYFAAGMPVCGGGDDTKAGLITHIPIHAFHGKLDQLVIPARTTNMVNNIKLNGGTLAEVTIFNNLGHLCWNAVYSDLNNIRWLLSQNKSKQ